MTQSLYFTPEQVSDTNWKIVAVGDFNADAKPDLVWQHQTEGYIGVWLMDGTTLAQAPFFTPAQVSDTNWKIVAVGDFNSDGRSDLVWDNRVNGYMGVWFMDGTTQQGSTYFNPVPLTDAGWQLVGVGDFNSDRKADLVWQHQPSGSIAAWLMNGTNLLRPLYFTPDRVSDTDWKIVGVQP